MICSPKLRAAVAACVLAATGMLANPGIAHTQPNLVNVCGSDEAAGGLNLAAAIAQGGPITIKCPAGQSEIKITKTRNLTADLSIAGDVPVTLRGSSSGPMFTSSHALTLTNLRLINNAAVTGSIVSGDQAAVTLASVDVEESPSAFLVRSLRADDSRFSNNGDVNAEASGSAVINAETVEVRTSEFLNNGDHPIAGGAWPAPDRIPLSRRITIDNSTFTGNRTTTLLIDAKVVIRGSTFGKNGRLPATARDSWGCCGGAITSVRSDVEIFDSDFRGNGSSGFGGAIYSVASRLTVERSTFEHNEARVGGAIMSWGHPPKLNIWSVADWIELPRLVLSRVTFKENKAIAHGGAIAFAGAVQGQSLVMTGNEASTAGGAIASWRAAPLPDSYGTVLSTLVDYTQPAPSDRIVLARSILVENKAGKSGAALALSDADAVIGNSVIARNNAATGTVVAGAKLRMVNTVLADNAGTGIEAPVGATISLGNTVIVRNTTNCMLAQPLLILGPNIQHPGNQCGSQIQSTDPGLDGDYAPGLISAARDAGDFGLCVTEPTVAGLDLRGRTRIGSEQKCAVGAIERDVPDAVASALTFGATQHFGPCFVWLLILLLLVALVVGFMLWRRRRRRKNGSR